MSATTLFIVLINLLESVVHLVCDRVGWSLIAAAKAVTTSHEMVCK